METFCHYSRPHNLVHAANLYLSASPHISALQTSQGYSGPRFWYVCFYRIYVLVNDCDFFVYLCVYKVCDNIVSV